MSFGDSWTAFFQRRQQNVWASPIYHYTSPLFHGYSSHIHQPLQFTPLNTTQLITLSRKLCGSAKWPGATKNRVIQSNEIQRMLTTLLRVKYRFYLSLRPRRTCGLGGCISHLGTLLFSQSVSCREAEPKKELCVRNEWFIPATYSNCAHYAVNLTPGLLWLIRSKMGKIQWRVERKLNNWMRATDVGTLQTGRSGWILSTTLVPVPSQIIFDFFRLRVTEKAPASLSLWRKCHQVAASPLTTLFVLFLSVQNNKDIKPWEGWRALCSLRSLSSTNGLHWGASGLLPRLRGSWVIMDGDYWVSRSRGRPRVVISETKSPACEGRPAWIATRTHLSCTLKRKKKSSHKRVK